MKSLLLTLTLALYVTECKATKGYQRRLSGDEWDEIDCVPCKPGMILNSKGCCVCPPGTVLSTDAGGCIAPCPVGMNLVDGKCECPGGQVFDGDKCICLGGQVFDGDECRCPSDNWTNGICQPCSDGQVLKGGECIPVEPTVPDCPSGITPGNSNAKLQSRYTTNFGSRKMLHPHLRKWAELWLPRSLRFLHGVFRLRFQQIPSLHRRNLLPRRRHQSREILQPARNIRRTSTRVRREGKDLRQ
jgi:hypothetical protein